MIAERRRRAAIAHGSLWSATAAVAVLNVVAVSPLRAQESGLSRAAILAAEDRRAPTLRDLATIRGGLRGRDPETTRIAVRALGRLERPELIPEIVPSLRHPEPEVRAEAANAVAQAAQGLKKSGRHGSQSVRKSTARGGPTATAAVNVAIEPLVARLRIEADSSVRAALCQSLGRLPFASGDQGQAVERELLASLDRDASVAGRLGVAAGLEALARSIRRVAPVSDDPTARAHAAAASIGLSDSSIAALKSFAAVRPNEAASAARVRRLAVESLTTAGAIDSETIRIASTDPDAQVRRLAVKAAGTGDIDAIRRTAIAAGLHDESPMVRYEALRVAATMPADGGCATALEAAADRDSHVSLLALDALGSCGWSTAAIDRLDRAVHAASGSPRAWHVPAHALVALSTAAPSVAAAALVQFSSSSVSWLRMYAARAAANLEDRGTLERLSSDADDNVREAATVGLTKVEGHDADETYIAQLSRPDQQLVRTAAIALSGTTHKDAAIPALRSALQRLNGDSRETLRDARSAIAATLQDLGVEAEPPRPVEELRPNSDVTSAELRRLQGARARITMRGLGAFDLALIVSEAPASVIRFVQLAERGYYNGLTFHRVVPNFVVQGGSPNANEYAGDPMYMRDELGLWPHVRGAVGVSTRGRDTGDAQIFIDLVDNPRLDHEYTVFAQVLNGMNVVDQILEGDVIERVEILGVS